MFLRLILARFGIHPNANAEGQINVQTGDAQDGGGGNCPCAASLAVPGNLQQDNADLAAAAEGVPLSLHAAAPVIDLVRFNGFIIYLKVTWHEISSFSAELELAQI